MLVVGIGNSAVDIVSELSRKGVAERVLISTRSGAWVIPKYVLGRPIDTIIKTNPRLPLGPQRRLARVLPRLLSGRMEDFGLPKPNHHFLEAHPTVSSELLLRLGSGDAIAKPDITELLTDRVRLADDSTEQIDAIIYATGYKITCPFFDPAFISAPGNMLTLYQRMFKPGIDDLAFIGLGQAIPTIFPFAECQSKLAARWLTGDWAPPPPPRCTPKSAATNDATSATTPRAPATPCKSTTTSTSTTYAHASSQPVWNAPHTDGPGRRASTRLRLSRSRPSMSTNSASSFGMTISSRHASIQARGGRSVDRRDPPPTSTNRERPHRPGHARALRAVSSKLEIRRGAEGERATDRACHPRELAIRRGSRNDQRRARRGVDLPNSRRSGARPA